MTVFPTRVGMARPLLLLKEPKKRFPHPRGDGPRCVAGPVSSDAFSPPAWGWPGNCRRRLKHRPVFPTRVGMARFLLLYGLFSRCFPHPRGDGPISWALAPNTARFSPPAWGWPALARFIHAFRFVFPTRVGMARDSLPPPLFRAGFPHPRGDGPKRKHRRVCHTTFSPPAWGWPAMNNLTRTAGRVFPTRVGMARVLGVECIFRKSFPHPRGDGPKAR